MAQPSEEFVLLHFYDHFSPLRSMNTRSWVLETIFSWLATFSNDNGKILHRWQKISALLVLKCFPWIKLDPMMLLKTHFQKITANFTSSQEICRWSLTSCLHISSPKKKTHQFDDVCRKKKTRILISSSNFVSFISNYKNSHRCIKFHRLIFRLEWVRSAAGNPFHSVADLSFFLFLSRSTKRNIKIYCDGARCS